MFPLLVGHQLTDRLGSSRFHDSDAIRVIVEHRREAPVALFSLDGRPHLRLVDVGRTDVSAYQALLTEAAP